MRYLVTGGAGVIGSNIRSPHRILIDLWMSVSVLFCKHLVGLLRKRQDTEDAAQRTFRRVFTNLSSFRGSSASSNWLTRIHNAEAPIDIA